jgi:hypothetical protein
MKFFYVALDFLNEFKVLSHLIQQIRTQFLWKTVCTDTLILLYAEELYNL